MAGAQYNLELLTVGGTHVARIYPATARTAPAWQARAAVPVPAAVTAPGSIGFSDTTPAGATGVAVRVMGVNGLAIGQNTPSTQPSPSAQPGPTNTGVPAGTQLTVHYGDMNITTPGTVISGLDIHGSVNIAGSNATVKDSWLHDAHYFAVDPGHGNGPCHCDGLQITVGTNIHIEHNLIRGGDNAAIMVSQDQGITRDVAFLNNWFDGGSCSLHINDKPLTSMTNLTITGNVFMPNSTIAHCAAVVTHAVTMSWTGNTWTSGAAAAPIIYG